jgi:hypothetical protein
MARLIVKWAFLQHLKPVQSSVDPVGILSEKHLALEFLKDSERISKLWF